ncbi:uncharacterized protein LOC34620125 [Cyclospora cayetanensis]|uniref:Uncharacterized protein LOC34620125 n=1 Tax=Cyclospora cayetanensis TaxID=88456 RepID=A0A6P6S4I2_9EIME|nr:uncharacterized protein LOC34620125 [Cyclospora cayetanensis]
MACVTAASPSYEGAHFFRRSSPFGAISASVEADVASSDSKHCLTEHIPEQNNKSLSSRMGCYLPLNPFSSPVKSPAGCTVSNAPTPIRPSRDDLSPSKGSPWLGHPSLLSGESAGHIEKYIAKHDSTDGAERPPCMALPEDRYSPQKRLLLPLDESSIEGGNSETSPTPGRVQGSIDTPNDLLQNSAEEDSDVLVDKESCYPFGSNSCVARHRATQQYAQSAPDTSMCSSLWEMNAKTAPRLSYPWNATCGEVFCGEMQIQLNASESLREEELLSPLRKSPPTHENPRSVDTINKWKEQVGAVQDRSRLRSVECLDNADDGRLWLDHLEKLRGGAPKEEYKRERTRVVDALIRRAAAYPKVSGIYFDKHQLRWSVGWAHNGRRAAKYFPVKLFGMREGYDMAVSFKATKTTSMEAIRLSVANSDASELSNGITRNDNSADNRAVDSVGSGTHSGISIAPFTAGPKVALPIQRQPLVSSDAITHSHMWHGTPKSCAPYPTAPTGTIGLTESTSHQMASAKSAAHATAGTAPATLYRAPCSNRLLGSAWQESLTTPQIAKVEAVEPTSDTSNSSPATTEQATHRVPLGILHCRPNLTRWPYSATATVDQRTFWHPETVYDNERFDNQTILEPRLISTNPCYSASMQKPYVHGSEELGQLLAFTSPDHCVPRQKEISTMLLGAPTQSDSRQVEASINATAVALPAQPDMYSNKRRRTEKQLNPSAVLSTTQEQGFAQDSVVSASIRPLMNHESKAVTASPLYLQGTRAMCAPYDGESPNAGLAAESFNSFASRLGANEDWNVAGDQRGGLEARLLDSLGSKSTDADSGPIVPQRYERQSVHNLYHLHYTPGIHFDKHSLRWKATWYDISGHRKAKYFPIAISNTGEELERSQLNRHEAFTNIGYDEERDRRLSVAPSRVLIRQASRLTRVPGVWFDKKQLRWACTFTDKESGKRRAEYFPIRHFGFLGARLLAVDTRQRMERFWSTTRISTKEHKQRQRGDVGLHGISEISEGTMSEISKTDGHHSLDAGLPDIWNKYVLEILQRNEPLDGSRYYPGDEAIFTLKAGCFLFTDGWGCCDANSVDRGDGTVKPISVWEEASNEAALGQAEEDEVARLFNSNQVHPFIDPQTHDHSAQSTQSYAESIHKKRALCHSDINVSTQQLHSEADLGFNPCALTDIAAARLQVRPRHQYQKSLSLETVRCIDGTANSMHTSFEIVQLANIVPVCIMWKLSGDHWVIAFSMVRWV